MELQKDLDPRHLLLLALGGSIGTGIFLASGYTLYVAAPLLSLIIFIFIGIVVYFLSTSLSEMAAYMPVSGSFSIYASRFVDPALGFALGWNYWFNWSISIAAEIVSCSLLMKFWFLHFPIYVWSLFFLFLILFLNLLSVSKFGEAEYWFALFKVLVIVFFIVFCCCALVGVLGPVKLYFSNFSLIKKVPFVVFLNLLVIAGFAFQGTELVSIAASETKNPSLVIPKVTNKVFLIVFSFYILALILISSLIPLDNAKLMSENISSSPFTLVLAKLGIPFAASFMNIVIILAILSAANSGMYAATRMLWSLSKEGKAYTLFAKLNKKKVPIYALFFTFLIGIFSLLTIFFNDLKVYVWLLNSAGLSGFISWLGIALSHYRFRKAFCLQGKKLSSLPFVASFFPLGPYLTFFVSLIIVVFQGLLIFKETKDFIGLFFSYISLMLFFVCYLYFKFKYKTKVLSLKNIDFENVDNKE